MVSSSELTAAAADSAACECAAALSPTVAASCTTQPLFNGLCRTPDNPDGYISMVVAENRLSSDLIREGLLQHATDWPPSMLHYQDARGIPKLRAALARMVQRTFMKVCASGAKCMQQQQQQAELHAEAAMIAESHGNAMTAGNAHGSSINNSRCRSSLITDMSTLAMHSAHTLC